MNEDNLINGRDFNDDKTINYINLFSSLPNFNFNKEIVIDDFYNPTLYKWDGNWIVSWISDEGDSLLDFVGSTPEEVIKKAVEYIKENYPFYFGSKKQQNNSKMEKKFELTAEEVEIVKHALKYTQGSSKFYNPILNEAIIDGNPFYPILKRINQWQEK